MALNRKTKATEEFENNDHIEETNMTDTATETAVTAAPLRPLAAAPKKFTAALTNLEGQLDVDQVRALGVGTLPKLVADRGGFELGDKSLGEWADIHILSYNKRWLVTPGVEGEEAKALLRTSYDGETLENDPRDIREYLQFLADEGYEKASSRQYIDIWGYIVNTDKGGEIAEDDYEFVQVQLSPSSVKEFTAFQIQQGLQAGLRKREVSSTVRATIEKREYGGNRYASIKFSSAV